jgi:hypothetical protein
VRPISDLIDDVDPAWPLVERWIGEAVVPVEVLPADMASNAKAGPVTIGSTLE